MSGDKRKIRKYIYITIVAALLSGFLINWILTHKLENFLKKELGKEVYKLTDGFYQLSYEDLSIGLFSGGLKISGLRLEPDSMLLRQLSLADSLPDTYLKVYADMVDFGGLNLTWLFNYRRLDFGLFEIKKPYIEVIKPYQKEKRENNKPSKDLYELVSPYFDVTTIGNFNLENATVVYKLEEPEFSTVYSLRDITFHAYGFRLDKNSALNGKLLYCHDFDFITNQPQQLIVNEEFTLVVKQVNFDTRRSFLTIRDMEFTPRTQLWDSLKRKPDEYIQAKIEAADIQEFTFKRKNGNIYLKARSLKLAVPDIEYFDTDIISPGFPVSARPDEKPVSPGEWSLYDIISPFIYTVSLDSIKFENTKFRYSSTKSNGVDFYRLDNFDFLATGFLLDTSSVKNTKFLYSDNISFDAENLKANLNSKNHIISVGRIAMDTGEERFIVENISLNPVTIKGQYDYLQGSIDAIQLTGLKYQDGIRADLLKIDYPEIYYSRIHQSPQKQAIVQQGTKKHTSSTPSVFETFTSVYNYFFIKDIRINQADFTYTDSKTKDTYRIGRFDFWVNDFLINDTTRRTLDWYFDYTDFGFHFRNYDNYLQDGTYRLMFDEALFTGMGGKLQIKDFRLLPQEKALLKASGKYIRIISPYFLLDNVNYKDRVLSLGTLLLKSPEVKVIDTGINNVKASPSGNNAKNPSGGFVDKIVLQSIRMENTGFSFINKAFQDSLSAFIPDLQSGEILWDIKNERRVSAGSVILENPYVDFVSNKPKEDTPLPVYQAVEESYSSIVEYININRIGITGSQVSSSNSDMKIDLDLKGLYFTDLAWKLGGQDSYFEVEEINISQPLLILNRHSVEKDTIKKVSGRSQGDIYNSFGKFSNTISIGKVRLDNMNMEYSQSFINQVPAFHELNRINFYTENLHIDNWKKTIAYTDLRLSAGDIRFPLSGGFYTLEIGSIDLSAKGTVLDIENVHMVSRYPKLEFAYRHPNHTDWFDVKVGGVKAAGIDFPRYLSDSVIYLDDLQVNDVYLGNFKNQKIEIEHHIMPMIYETIQKAPVKFDVRNMDVRNFSVVYEELPKKGEVAGKIFFTGMNGHFTGFTNIVKHPQQYIRLDADGRFMGKGDFTATWQVPVDTLNDRFIMNVHLQHFNFAELNPVFTPLANVEINSGYTGSTMFDIDASSIGARIDMEMLYNNLKFELLKEKNGKLEENTFITDLADIVVRDNNPNKPGEIPRTPYLYVKRDPYHSTFNYLWQILQPALGESAGISQEVQDFFKGIPKTMVKLKNFFWPDRKEGSGKHADYSTDTDAVFSE